MTGTEFEDFVVGLAGGTDAATCGESAAPTTTARTCWGDFLMVGA